MSRMTGWILVLCSACFDSYAAIVVKRHLNDVSPPQWTSVRSVFEFGWRMISSPALLLGLILFGSAPALWFLALQRLPLTTAYPVLVAIHLLLVLFGGWYVLSEQVSVAKAVSCLLLIVSIGLIYLSE